MKKYFTLAVVATMFAACSNEVVDPQVDALTGMPIQVKTNVASLVESRVAGMDSEDDFSTFYLDITPKNAGDTDYYAVMKKGTDGSWTGYETATASSPLQMVWVNGNAVQVSAFVTSSSLPNENYFNSGTNFQVSKDQSTDSSYKNGDMLYMKPTDMAPTADGSITVTFSHLMSKVRISIVTGTSENENPVSEVKVNGTKYQFGFVPKTGTWNALQGNAEAVTTHYDSYTEGISVYEVILVPQEVAANTFSVSFTMGGKNYQWTSSESVNLESGKLYTLALEVPDNDPTGKAIAVSLSVAEWPKDAVTITGGEVSEVEG